MKKKNIVVWIFVIIMSGLLIWFGMYAMNATKEEKESIKKDSPKQEQNNNKQTKNEKQESKMNDNEDDIYGYINTRDSIIELHKSGKNKTLATTYTYRRFFTAIKIIHNKLIYKLNEEKYVSENVRYNEEIYYIDLDNKSKKPIQLTSGVDMLYDFDLTGNDIYFSSGNGVEKYNIKTKKKEIITQEIIPEDLFVNDNKMYLYDLNTNKHYIINLDGSDFSQISEEEYNKSVEIVGYKTSIETPNPLIYLIYNNKKVSTSDDHQQVLYDDEVIFTARENRYVSLLYSMNSNEIIFYEGFTNIGAVHIDTDQYYKYNLVTKELTEITDKYKGTYVVQLIYTNE